MGTHLIERQRESIKLMRLEGSDPQAAIDVLAELEASVRAHMEDRQRLLRELRRRHH